MENILSPLSGYFTNLKEWILALSVIPATLFLIARLRILLKDPKRWPKSWPAHWREAFTLQQLWPSISAMILILSLTFMIEIAPLEGRVYSWLANILFVLNVLISLNLLQRVALLGLQWASRKAKHYETFDGGFVPLLQNVLTIFTVLTGGIIVLKHFNYDVMSLITALGVGSLAVGLAAKDTLSNMISGFILIIDRNLRPGDRINLSGTIGDVKEIGLRSTQIRVSDGNTLIVPNSELVNNRILNLSLPNREITSVIKIRVPYSVPFPKVKSICLQISTQIDKISNEKPIVVHLNSLAEGYQLISITIWVSDFTSVSTAVSDFNVKLLACLDQEKIPLITRLLCSQNEFA